MKTYITCFISMIAFIHCTISYAQPCGQGNTKITIGGTIASTSQTACVNQQITYGITGTTPLSAPSWCVVPETAGTFVNGINSGNSVSVIWLTAGNLRMDYPNFSGNQCEELYYTLSAMPGTITGTSTVCLGGSGSFTISSNPGAVTWQKCTSGCSTTTDTGWTTNTTGSSFTNLTASTQFRAKLNDTSCGLKYSNILVVTVTALPVISITGSNTFCAESSTVLTATASMSSYQWYKDGTLISGASASTYSVSGAGTYKVVVSNNGCTNTSANHTVTLTAPPNAIITPVGATKIASTATQTITVSTGSGYTFQWLKDGAAIPGATAQSYSTGTPGVYSVRVTQNGCSSISSTLAITKNLVPIVSAGINQTLSYESGMMVSLNGNAADGDGSISSLLWTKVSGPSVTLSGTTSSTLLLSNLNAGTYSFRLSATDNFGESAISTASVIINPPGNDYNHIVTAAIQIPGVTVTSGTETLTVDQKASVYQYFDGLGRPMQSVTKQGSPSRLDLVQPVIYDIYGRENKKYLPFTTQNNGWYKPTPEIIDLTTGNYKGIALPFYATVSDKIADDTRPYSETTFESSPLHRPDKEYGAGASWYSNGRSIQHGYFVNTHGTSSGQEKVIAWSVNSSDMPVRNAAIAGYVETGGYYSSGQLNVKSTKDEEGNEVREYSDKSGKVILKKVQVVASAVLSNRDHWAQTYYVYDDKENLRFVLPPALSYLIYQNDLYNPTSPDLDAWAFRYTYDSRSRMITKQVPGAGQVYMVYDLRDRLILTQDFIQRTASPYRWTFTKYDELNRPVLTGIKDTTASLSQQQMQVAVNNHFAKASSRWSETYVGNITGNVHGYSNKAYPVRTGDALEINPNKYLTVTYYDNYDFRSLWAGSYAYVSDGLSKTVNAIPFNQPALEHGRVIGQVTGGKVKVLDGGTTGGYTWLKSINYYDDTYRNIQVIADNYKGGYDRVSTLYDFVGKVLKTKSTHTESDITWKDQVAVNLIGNQLISTSTTAGAASVQTLAAGQNGWMEVIYSEGNTTRYIGLNDTNPDASAANINYAFRFTATNTANVYENNTLKATVTGVMAGDVFRISRTGTVITYTRNGVMIPLSPASTTSTTLLMVDASFATSGATITDVRTSFSTRSSTVSQNFDYDHGGRLLRTWHQVDANPEIVLALNEYNELGQLVDKKLHSTVVTGSNAKQSVDYRYNIRGWLTRINESDINVGYTDPTNNGEARDLFGMSLAYNNVIAGITTGNGLFNGNISSVSWSNNQGLGTTKENGFVYTYDPMSRLKSGIHKVSSVANTWTSGTYEESISSYDLNGNIMNLYRKGEAASVIDNLTYTYTGNKLMKVSDSGDKTKGFLDGDNSVDDYVYDVNGNLVWDRNKGGEETVINSSFESGSANWTITDPNLRLTFANNEVSVIGGTKTAILTQGGIVKGKPYVVVVDLARTAGSITVDVGGTKVTVSTNGVRAISLNAGTKHTNISVTAATSFAGKIKSISVKGVTVITYNYMNLPEIVTRAGDQQVQYIYDATGRKLAQELSKNSLLEKRTDYAGNYYYENDTLKFIQHEEGRIIMTGTAPEYQYHLKDHLGNVRLTFTSKDEIESAKATMETANVAVEQSQFLNYDEAIKVNSTIFDRTNTGGTYYSTRLTGGTTNAKIGLAKSLSVMPGDKIDMEVFVKYLDPTSANWTAAMISFMAAIAGGTAPAGTVIDGGMAGSLGSGTFPFTGFLSHTGETGTSPKAYLNYLVFDRNYVFKTGGFRRVSTAARETGTDILHERLSFDGAGQIVINEPGYVYIWLSNENETAVEVYFDDFKVTHTKSPVIQQDDYYPFGLTFNSYQRENAFVNKIKFQGQEHIDDLGLNWDSFKWRNHQPDIGRFFNVDPLADKYVNNSPYAFSENNVTVHIELEGLEKVYIFDQPNRPQDNGTVGITYSASVFVEHDDGTINGPYSGSTYPDSKSNTDNSTEFNTIDEGEHQYNNASGHKTGTKKGLNIINDNGIRVAPGKDPEGNSVTMTVVNVHKGASDNGNSGSRGSQGCLTILPNDAVAFFNNFDWSGANGTTGNSSGTILIYRGDSEQRLFDEIRVSVTNTISNLEPEIIEN